MNKIRFKLTPKRGVGLIIIILAVAYLLVLGGNALRERLLLAKHKENPENKRFIESIYVDFKDLASNPDHNKEVAATMDLGLQWYNMLEYSQAARWWSKGLKIEPNNDLGWFNLGNAYLYSHDYLRSEKAYRTSMSYAGPGEVDGCLGLGDLYKYNFKARALREDDVYLECIQKHGQERNLLARLAGFYRDHGDIKNAILYFDKLFSIEPTPEVGEEIRALQIKQDEIDAAKKAAYDASRAKKKARSGGE